MMLLLQEIRMDGGTQPRAVLDTTTIEDYATAMITGVEFPAITVFYDGEVYWLADGFHRTKAAIKAGLLELEAEIIQGTLDDARWHSFGANKSHGLRRTNEDKQRVVQAALLHANSAVLSDRELARHMGLSHQMVGGWRTKLSGQISQIDPASETARTITRNGTTYQQRVSAITASNIGRKQTRDAAESMLGPAPPAMQIPVPDRRAVWACQMRKNFEKELLRLIKAYEKSNPPIDALVVTRNNGLPVGVEIASSQSEVA